MELYFSWKPYINKREGIYEINRKEYNKTEK